MCVKVTKVALDTLVRVSDVVSLTPRQASVVGQRVKDKRARIVLFIVLGSACYTADTKYRVLP